MGTNTLVLCRIWGFAISASSADTDEHRTELAGVILAAQVRLGGACHEHQRTVVLIRCRAFCNIWSHRASVTAMLHNKFYNLGVVAFSSSANFLSFKLGIRRASSSFSSFFCWQNRSEQIMRHVLKSVSDKWDCSRSKQLQSKLRWWILKRLRTGFLPFSFGPGLSFYNGNFNRVY